METQQTETSLCDSHPSVNETQPLPPQTASLFRHVRKLPKPHKNDSATLPNISLLKLPETHPSASLEEVVTNYKEHLVSLETFKAQLTAMLEQVVNCEQETMQHLKTLEAAQFILTMPLPSLVGGVK